MGHEQRPDNPKGVNPTRKGLAAVARALDARLNEISDRTGAAEQSSNSAASRYEVMSEAELKRVIITNIDAIASFETIAPPFRVDLAVQALLGFGVRPKPRVAPCPEDLLVKSLEEQAVHLRLQARLAYAPHKRRAVLIQLRDFGFELDRRIDMLRGYQQTLHDLRRITHWGRDGQLQIMLDRLAQEFERPPLFLVGFRCEFEAEMGETPVEFAARLRKVARVGQAAADRAQAERETRAVPKHKSPRPKAPMRTLFAVALIELAGKYLDMPTGLTLDDRDQKVGPIVDLGKILAPIWGIEAASGETFAEGKRLLKRWRRGDC
jgi:hypothetical protein